MTEKRKIPRTELKLKVVRHLLKKKGSSMTTELAATFDVQLGSLQNALKELREAGVIDSSQGIPGVKLALPREALTVGLVLGPKVQFVDPNTHIDELP